MFSVGQRVIRWRKNDVMTSRVKLGMCASGLAGDCGNLVKVRLSDGSIGQVCFPSDKELSDGEKNDVMTTRVKLGMCASGVVGHCGKVRLSDGSDGSIGQACFPSDKELFDGEKMTS